MSTTPGSEILALFDGSVQMHQGILTIKDERKLRSVIGRVAEASALESGPRQGWAQYFTRRVAYELGIHPASIHELYMARGRGEVPPVFTVPAINLRILAFEAARAAFRASCKLGCGPVLFEIARSEMTYTSQRPAEYVTSVLAAAIAEGYRGPVFIQGDHFQVSAKRFASDRDTEINTLKALMKEAIEAGFYNIDVDTSTMVDLSQDTIRAQQAVNSQLTAMFAFHIRGLEPNGVKISIGGEIGEVGGHNSTEEELRAFLDGFNNEVTTSSGSMTGLSKISIQTGTSHGGVVLPDGSIAQVEVDFGTLKELGRIARKDYGMGGTVQHGASTLPESAFGKFVEAEACEVHLATNFQNIFFDMVPASLKEEMYAYLREKSAGERKADMTDEQFYYKTRKNVIGPFKAKTWHLPQETKDAIRDAWESQFTRLFTQLGLQNTRKYVDRTIHPTASAPDLRIYLGEAVAAEEVSDLAD